jgi:4-amino-4-deoxy-L-arabinose transferase-like glycosyltransferase
VLRAPRRALPGGTLAWIGLAGAVAGAAVMNTVRLSQNGYANIFYSAGVRSMLDSLHNFFFVSFDPGGLITVDKPPLALWVQALSAKIFGFHPLSLLLPEALIGVVTVAVLYLIVLRRFGALAAFAAALTLATFPSFVAVSRANGVDPLLILLLTLACGAGVKACETGRWRTLLRAGLLIGLAFNTKTLAAYLVVPAIAFAYLLCGPDRLPRRIVQLLAAGLLSAAVSFAWIAAVEATPAAKRPYVGSSTNNTEIGLTFEYNGFGRVEGQAGGPGTTHGRPGAFVPGTVQQRVNAQRGREHALARIPPRSFPSSTYNRGRNPTPIPFGEAPGPLRLLGTGLGDQGGWLLPFALLGALAALLLCLLGPAEAAAPFKPSGRVEPAAAAEPRMAPQPGWRRDPRLACVLVLGGWLVTEVVVLSASKGIVHPYYVSALGPGVGAMAGIGAVAIVRLCRGRTLLLGLGLAGLAGASSLATEIVLMRREDYMRSFQAPLLVLVALALGALLLAAVLHRPRAALGAIAATLTALLIVPTGYASSTWLAPVEPTFPAAGPKQTAGEGGVGLNPRDLAINEAIMSYVRGHSPTRRFQLLTVASDTAAPYILMGLRAGALAGYSGVDQAMDAAGMARLVGRREARYVLLGGEYSLRGGNGATRAVITACRELAPAEWQSPVAYPFGLVLFDCAGDAAALARA